MDSLTMLLGLLMTGVVCFWSFVLWRSQIMPQKRGICITHGNGLEVRWFARLFNYVGTKYVHFFGRYIIYFNNKWWEEILDIPGEVELLKGERRWHHRGSLRLSLSLACLLYRLALRYMSVRVKRHF